MLSVEEQCCSNFSQFFYRGRAKPSYRLQCYTRISAIYPIGVRAKPSCKMPCCRRATCTIIFLIFLFLKEKDTFFANFSESAIFLPVKEKTCRKRNLMNKNLYAKFQLIRFSSLRVPYLFFSDFLHFFDWNSHLFSFWYYRDFDTRANFRVYHNPERQIDKKLFKGYFSTFQALSHSNK